MSTARLESMPRYDEPRCAVIEDVVMASQLETYVQWYWSLNRAGRRAEDKKRRSRKKQK